MNNEISITKDDIIALIHYVAVNHTLYEVVGDYDAAEIWFKVRERLTSALVQQKERETTLEEAARLHTTINKVYEDTRYEILDIRNQYAETMPPEFMASLDGALFESALDHYAVNRERVFETLKTIGVEVQTEDGENQT